MFIAFAVKPFLFNDFDSSGSFVIFQIIKFFHFNMNLFTFVGYCSFKIYILYTCMLSQLLRYRY